MRVTSLLLMAVSLHSVLSVAALPRIQVDPASGFFVDPAGRARLFHGVNAVEKKHPFLPPRLAVTDTTRSLNADDAAQLAGWGFNVVRLGVLWQAVAPSGPEPSSFNYSYLAEVKLTIETLAARGIYTIVDMHQDVLGDRFCGEGLPSWTVARALAIAANKGFNVSDGHRFPAPQKWDMGIDPATGLPSAAKCAEHPFANYYSTDEAAAALKALFSSPELSAAFAAHWGAVAAALGGSSAVFGYELLNEPFNASPFASDAKELLPLYQALTAAIRVHDNASIVLYEPHVLRSSLGFATDFPAGGVEGSAHDNRQALAYHVYCFNTTAVIALPICKLVIDDAWEANKRGRKRVKGGGFLTEFGAVGDDQVSLDLLEYVLSEADVQLQSWAYWTYKSFDDITTANGHSETFFNFDPTSPAGRTVQTEKVRKLTRPYAPIIAGTPISQSFAFKTNEFTLKYTATPLQKGHLTNLTTRVFAHRELHYPHGVDVKLTPSTGITWSLDGDWITVTYDPTQLPQGAATSITLTLRPTPAKTKQTLTTRKLEPGQQSFVRNVSFASSGALATLPPMACQSPSDAANFPFCNMSLPIAARVADFAKRVELKQKPHLLTARDGYHESGGINPISFPELAHTPGYYWGTNCIQSVENCAHGECTVFCPTASDGTERCATHFPSPPGQNAAFNRTLIATMAKTMSTELRAFYNIGSATGLDCWGPVMNVARDPRWGRNGESGSEDPYALGEFASAWTQGFQQDDGVSPLAGIVTLKHWDANSLEGCKNDGCNGTHNTRHNFNVNISKAAAADMYFPHFRSAIINGGARGMMCSYNALRGVPTCTSKLLKNKLKQWNFSGYVSSDSDSLSDAWKKEKDGGHGYFPDAEHSTAAALTTGWCDVNSGKTFLNSMINAVTEGLVAEVDVDAAVARTLKMRFELGLFDAKNTTPKHARLTALDADAVGTAASAALSLEMARQSLVLLQNGGGSASGGESGAPILPFDPSLVRHLAVIGPLADDADTLMGTHFKGYACRNDKLDDLSCVPTIGAAFTAALQGKAPVDVVPGCTITTAIDGGVAAAVTAAKKASHIILTLGISRKEETEAHDRVLIDLPQVQHDIATAVLALGLPTVVITISGGAVSIAPELKAGATTAAFINAFIPGPHGGAAIADAVFGAYSPSGRLPYTMYDSAWVFTTAMSEMDPAAPPGRTYRFRPDVADDPLVHFGFGRGLSYAHFQFALRQSQEEVVPLVLPAGGSKVIPVTIEVSRPASDSYTDVASEVILAFFEPEPDAAGEEGGRSGDDGSSRQLAENGRLSLRRQLFDFQKIALRVGEKKTIVFKLSAAALHRADAYGGSIVSAPGKYRVVFTAGNGENATTVTLPLIVSGSKPVVVEAWPEE